jgi:adenylate cyclase
MALEIERKFLVAGKGWEHGVARRRDIRQAYLSENGDVSIRIRIDGVEAATLTIKTAEPGIARQEYEYAIPVGDAEALLLHRTGLLITKTRNLVPVGNLVWEVDVFRGECAGLVLAEIELASPDQAFDRPSWLGAEVTHDRRFYNSDLAKHPYAQWRSS